MSDAANGELGKRARLAADALFEARTGRCAIPPVSETLRIDDPVVAYSVREANTLRWLASGRKLVGRKIGLTAHAAEFNRPVAGFVAEAW